MDYCLNCLLPLLIQKKVVVVQSDSSLDVVQRIEKKNILCFFVHYPLKAGFVD